jgi:hypothetical protein
MLYPVLLAKCSKMAFAMVSSRVRQAARPLRLVSIRAPQMSAAATFLDPRHRRRVGLGLGASSLRAPTLGRQNFSTEAKFTITPSGLQYRDQVVRRALL